MKELSIFIDESGDFGELLERPAYYLVTRLFHDQNKEIISNVKNLRKVSKNQDLILSIYIRDRLLDERMFFQG